MKCWSHKWGVLGVWLLIKYTAVPTLESLRHGFRYNLGSLTWSRWPNGCQPRCWARQLTAALDFCTPRLLLITAECLLAESSAFQLQPHIQGAKHAKKTVVLLKPQLAMASTQSRIMLIILPSTVIIKTKATYIFTYFIYRRFYGQLKNICTFGFGTNYNQTLIKVEPGSWQLHRAEQGEDPMMGANSSVLLLQPSHWAEEARLLESNVAAEAEVQNKLWQSCQQLLQHAFKCFV